MKKRFSILAIFAAILLAALAASPVGASGGQGEVIAVTGIVPGQDLVVHILALVPPGADRAEVAKQALANQGARAVTKQEFSTIAISWDQFFDSNDNNDTVTQHYNQANEADPAGHTVFALSQQSWNDVATSSFTFTDGSSTTRCPSLVKECPGKQTFDGFNDVGWASIKGGNILGVTWTGTNIDEADMALNTKYNWTTGEANYNMQTVFLHENGHALGLGHSDVGGAVMWPSYSGMLLDLQQDDIDGVTAKYPAPGAIDLAITTTSLPGATEGSAYSGTLAAVGGSGSYTWSIAETLPSGLSLTASSGEISGTPAVGTEGNYSLTATVNDGTDTANATVTLAIGTEPVGGSSVSVASIVHTLSGGGSGDKDLRVKVNVVDSAGDPVASASVSILLSIDSSSTTWTATGSTGSDGSVTFRLRNAPSGCYSTEVEGVAAAGLDWDGVQPPASSVCKQSTGNKNGANGGSLQAE
jgi:hypothetical protein